MNKHLPATVLTILLLAVFYGSNVIAAPTSKVVDPSAGSTYYKEPPIFIPYPKFNDKKGFEVTHFGPVGIGVIFTAPGFTMKVGNIDKGSPAEKVGKLKKGQIIESINGAIPREIDPRRWLANTLAEAEATDGLINLKIQGVGNVQITLPVMGRYSDTWPLNCPKSDKVVRKLADFIAAKEKPSWGSMLFLMSTGEAKDVAAVKKWLDTDAMTTFGTYPWHVGMRGTGLCEYYLKTGDQRALPIIQEGVKTLESLIYNGGWSGRGHANITYSTGSGQLHAAGVHCLNFLLLAKQCGVELDDKIFMESLSSFYRFAGHANVAYGDGRPEGGYRDNGKTSALAMAMNSAVQLTPDGESSPYAKARDISALKSFYATSWFFVAHTGGGLGEVWHNVGMQLLDEKMPNHYRSFMTERQWMMDLSRRYDGTIGVVGGPGKQGYDESARGERDWGTFNALTYTASRRHLRMFGAPKTEYCKTYKLPERPWGNPMDDTFLSLAPGEYMPGKRQDISKERVRTDASAAVMRKFDGASAETILMYGYHPDYGLREAAVRTLVQNGHMKELESMFRSSDPRARQAAVLSISGIFKGRTLSAEQITPEMWSIVEKMVNDPDESWWGTQTAALAISRSTPEMVAKHKDRLIELVGHEDRWIKGSAMAALNQIALQKAHYKDVLPPIVNVQRDMSTMQLYGPGWQLQKAMGGADPEVKAFAAQLYTKAFAEIPPELLGSGGHTINNGAATLRGFMMKSLEKLGAAEGLAEKLPLKTSQWAKSGDQKHMLSYNGTFVANPHIMGRWVQASGAASPQELQARIQKELEREEAERKKLEKLKAQGKKPPKKKPAPKKKGKPSYIEFKDGGKLGGKSKDIWTGNYLIKVTNAEACQIKVFKIGGEKYLMIEKGNFRHDPNAKPGGWDVYTQK